MRYNNFGFVSYVLQTLNVCRYIYVKMFSLATYSFVQLLQEMNPGYTITPKLNNRVYVVYL